MKAVERDSIRRPPGDIHTLATRLERVERELVLRSNREAAVEARAVGLEEVNRALELEVAQLQLAERLARAQAELLIQSTGFLAAESNLDRFLGHVLRTTVDQLGCAGGTLWFPDGGAGTARLHLEYVGSSVIPSTQSRHPAVRQPPPVGGKPRSTFPDHHAETYVLASEVSGMPEENRAYILSLGVGSLLTVPMILGKETVGWICVRSSNTDAADMQSRIRVAEALAGQATLAVQMARLGESARQAAVLEERNRIARDIHDTLAQGFTGVILNLEASSRALKKHKPDAAREHLELARQLAQAGLGEARLSVRALRPDPLQRVDLGAALGKLVKRLEATGTVRASLCISGEQQVLRHEVELELLRIAQEAVTNVLKHARAKHVQLELSFAQDCTSLAIADDGVGFELTGQHDGFGLIGMRERSERLGARLLLDSARGGTRVSVTVPVFCNRVL